MFSKQTKAILLQLLLKPIEAYSSDIFTLLSLPSSNLNSIKEPEKDSHEPEGDKTEPEKDPISQSLGGFYSDLLFLQPWSIRRQVAHTIATNMVKDGMANNFNICTTDQINFIFGELCSVMIRYSNIHFRDQRDGNIFGSLVAEAEGDQENEQKSHEDLPLDWQDILEEQNLSAKLVHLVKNVDPDKEYLVTNVLILAFINITRSFWARR